MSTEERQIAFEEESLGSGRDRYFAMLEKGGEARMPPGMSLVNKIVEPLSVEIQNWLTYCLSGKAQYFASAAKYLSDLDVHVIAYIVAKVCIQALGRDQTEVSLSLDISRLLLDEVNSRAFASHDRKRYNRARDEVKKATSYRHRRTVMRVRAKQAGAVPKEWGIEIRTNVGKVMLAFFIKTTGLLEKYRRRNGNSKHAAYHVRGTEAAKAFLAERHEHCSLLTPIYRPMVIPPQPWTNPMNGGYLTMRLKFIKTHHRNYLEELKHYDMPIVYAAVNALQNTAWRINRRIYEVLSEVWNKGGCLGGLPSQEPKPEPLKPVDIDTNKEARKAWKKKATLVYEENARAASQWKQIVFPLEVAAMFLEEPEIYFPYTMDWRGRVYPVPPILNPQGSDVSKALLQFAHGKPLGARGAQWLMVHTANLFGVDKVSMEERVSWVEAHREALIDSAVDPLGGARFWAEADKPYQALAACFELYGYWTEGESFESRLPIAMDGSCNGIQNFSAMLRDYEGGCAVNLVPQELPQDIYARVAEVVSQKVAQDAAEGNEQALLWLGKVDRKIVKRPVMTLPYGATRYGMRQQLIDELKDQTQKGSCKLKVANNDFYWPCDYLSWIVYTSIGEVVSAARIVMDWLQEAARIASQDGMPINWVTPAGLPVLQAYRKTLGKRIECLIEGRKVKTTLQVPTKVIDTRRQAQGIAPNFVHSMDASHLMLTVNEAVSRGVTSFAMVHDSYATHAADSDTLAQTLRETFVRQYQTHDVLDEFRQQIVNQIDPKLAAEIPPVPEKGNLDLNLVKSSMYFFA